MSGFQVSTVEKDPSKFATAIQQLYAGRSNAAGSVTLAAGATSTVVQADNCAAQCAVFLFPKTANAAAALATTYISAVGKQSFTISHASNAQTDRSFSGWPLADLICVPPHKTREIWPLVADRIRSAVLRTDLSHTSDIERDLLEGDGLLWLACAGSTIEAAAATLLVRTDRHLVCIITALGGENMGRWLDLLAGVEEWAKAEGAALVRIYGRPGWVRMLRNYKVSNVVLERRL